MLSVPGYLFPSSGLGRFSHNFLKYIFNPLLSLFSFWDPYDVDVSILSVITELLISSHFFKFVFLFVVLIG